MFGWFATKRLTVTYPHVIVNGNVPAGAVSGSPD